MSEGGGEAPRPGRRAGKQAAGKEAPSPQPPGAEAGQYVNTVQLKCAVLQQGGRRGLLTAVVDRACPQQADGALLHLPHNPLASPEPHHAAQQSAREGASVRYRRACPSALACGTSTHCRAKPSASRPGEGAGKAGGVAGGSAVGPG